MAMLFGIAILSCNSNDDDRMTDSHTAIFA